MRRYLLFGLLAISLAIMVFFTLDAKNDVQSVEPLLEVGSKAVRDIVETTTAPIEVPVSVEIEIGRRVLQSFTLLEDNHPKVQYVRRIGNTLATFGTRQDIKYRFYVCKADMINAFALPGGFVVITVGMLEILENDDELAWIIGHELTHIEKRHALLQLRSEIVKRKLHLHRLPGMDTMVTMVGRILQLGYSETMELQADKEGLYLMHQAGFQTQTVISLVDYMLEQQPRPQSAQNRNPFHLGINLSKEALRTYFASHPHWERRKEQLLAEIKNYTSEE